jgi:hypothetical protein
MFVCKALQSNLMFVSKAGTAVKKAYGFALGQHLYPDLFVSKAWQYGQTILEV